MKNVLIVVAAIVFVLLAASFLRGFFGKPVLETLHVPQGRTRIRVHILDDGPLRPFKYEQVFEAIVLPGPTSMTSARTGQEQSGACALSYRGKPVGFVDETSSYAMVLSQYAERYKKVSVRTVVVSADSDGNPYVEILLPDAKWFARANKSYTRSLRLK